MTTATELSGKILDSIRAGTAPRQARLAAARGALPLSLGELVHLQILLTQDAEADIAATAKGALSALGADDVLPVAEDGECAVEVLEWLAANAARWPEAAVHLASHSRLGVEGRRHLARTDIGDALARLAANHQALRSDPELGPLLSENPALPKEVHSRLLDFLEEIAKRPAQAPSETPAEGDDEAGVDETAAPPARDPFLASLGIDAEVEALLPELDIDVGDLAERSELLGEVGPDDNVSLISKLSKMKVGQKLRVALFGTREERALLVRDSNRIVATSVIKNPKFTEQEAESVANSRNVSEDVLRLIAMHREFGKAYKIQHSLIRNPRVPVEMATRLVPSLREQDLKLLARNRNVKEAVRRRAKKQLEILGERRRVRVPGKR